MLETLYHGPVAAKDLLFLMRSGSAAKGLAYISTEHILTRQAQVYDIYIPACAVGRQTHVLRQPIFFSSMFIAVIFNLHRSCLVRAGVVLIKESYTDVNQQNWFQGFYTLPMV